MVLYRATMPAILIELGFLSNEKEEKFLSSSTGQKKLAEYIFSGFKKYKLKLDKVDGSIRKGRSDKPEKESSPLIEVKKDSGVVFKVQIATSSSKIDTTPENFKGLNGVEVYISGKFYKYTFGKCEKFNEAKKVLNEVKSKGFNTAFITAFEDGKKINLQTAIDIK